MQLKLQPVYSLDLLSHYLCITLTTKTPPSVRGDYMFVDTNAPEANQTLRQYTPQIEQQLLHQIRHWNKNIPQTTYHIVIVTQPFTKAVNVFTLRERYGTRGHSKSLARFAPNTITSTQIQQLAAEIKKANPNITVALK